MREAYRLQKHQLQNNDSPVALFFIYTGKEIVDFETIKIKMAIVLKNLSSQLSEHRS